MSVLNLPDLGEGLQEAEIVTWHVAEGDQVVGDQPLVSVETDKAVVEIPAPHAGRVAKLHAKAGDIVPIGAPLIEFDDGKAEDAGGIVGSLPTEAAPAKRERRRTRPEAPPATRQAVGRAAPAVRALARRLGVELASVQGSGPGGVILSRDVEAAAAGGARIEGGEPLRGVRRAMARNMAAAHREIVPATVMDEADIEGWPEGADATIRVVQAVAAACRAEPSLNAWYDSASDTRRVHDKVDLGIAVHTPDGLFVPVLRNVGGRDADDLRRGIEAMKADVEARSIPAEELRGATITLSNFGVFGVGRHAELVVSPPQVAIIGAGRISRRVVAGESGPEIHLVLPLSVTFDHRVIYGGEAAGFLRALVEALGRPA